MTSYWSKIIKDSATPIGVLCKIGTYSIKSINNNLSIVFHFSQWFHFFTVIQVLNKVFGVLLQLGLINHQINLCILFIFYIFIFIFSCICLILRFICKVYFSELD